jgi:hypothetical protein
VAIIPLNDFIAQLETGIINYSPFLDPFINVNSDDYPKMIKKLKFLTIEDKKELSAVYMCENLYELVETNNIVFNRAFDKFPKIINTIML